MYSTLLKDFVVTSEQFGEFTVLLLCLLEPPPEGEELDDAQAGLAKRFQDADSNKDGRLDRKEFVPFIHPFRHEQMIGHLVEDQLVLYDQNQDGMISLEEYTREGSPYTFKLPPSTLVVVVVLFRSLQP